MDDRRPGYGRYAHLEREQRWAVSGVPVGAELVAETTDRYITGTRLRVRRSTDPLGVDVFKLAQKVEIDGEPGSVKLTNIYLSADEYEVLAQLPGSVLRKSRWRTTWLDHPIAVDVFSGPLDGLVLAEVELEADEALLPMPPFATRDVTGDARCSGGVLASASAEEVERILSQFAGR